MTTKILPFIQDFLIFIIIFNFFNDSYVSDHFGLTVLRTPLLLLYVFCLTTIFHNFKTMTDTQDKLFFLFWLTSMTLALVELLLGWKVDPFPTLTLLFAAFTVVLFFGRYSLIKMLYFFWIAMMVSVIICYNNPTLDEWSFRATGGTEDANTFAAQLLAFLFGSIYLFNHNKSKLFLIFSVIFFTYGIFKAGSMTSFLVLGLLGSITFIRFIIHKPYFFINFKTLILLLVLFLAATQIDPRQIQAVNNMLNRTKNTSTADMRVHVWIAGLHMIEANPILGVGINAFAYHEKAYEEGHMPGAEVQPHSVFVKILAEGGIFVFALFLIFLGYIISVNIKKLFFRDEWFIMLMLLSVLLMGATLGYAYDKFFWFIITLMMNINYKLKRNLTT